MRANILIKYIIIVEWNLDGGAGSKLSNYFFIDQDRKKERERERKKGGRYL